MAVSANKIPYTVEELKANLLKLMVAEMDKESVNICGVIKDPKLLIGKFVRHKWDNATYDGQIKALNDLNPPEFEMDYFDQGGAVYLQVDEVVADLRSGDLLVLWDD